MKNYHAKTFASFLKESGQILFIAAAFMLTLLSCTDVHLEEFSQETFAATRTS